MAAKATHSATKMVGSAPQSANTNKKGNTKNKGKGSSTPNKGTQANKNSLAEKLKKIAKIERLPKTVRESIPVHGFMDNGIIENSPGEFSKTYKIKDVNFSIAPEEEQERIYASFMNFLNSFDSNIRWQFTIYNHEIDKKRTIEDIRIMPQKDGLNKYRQEMNHLLLTALKKGNNSITQEKYLTVVITDNNVEHAVAVFRKLDLEISKRLRAICSDETVALTSQERITLLYNIYNQDSDYRIATGIYNKKEVFDLRYLEKFGLSVKDVIGPSSFDFSPKDRFQVGDTYAQTLYLQRVPTVLTTNFISDLADIQNDLLISTYYEAIPSEKATKLVKNQIANIDGRIASLNKRNIEQSTFGALPPDLERSQKNARELMNDITSRNQNLFYVTFLVTVFARTLEQLDEVVKQVMAVSAKHLCHIKKLGFQQEFAFNSCLPLGRNDVFNELMYTTESAAVFIPYNAQEIRQKNAIFYGLNQNTKGMVLCDRTTGANYNGLIFGFSGSGKSFTAKLEMISVLLSKPNAQVFVIDPQGEYRPLAAAFGGEEIYLAPGSHVYINPLDLDISANDDSEDAVDPVTMKTDFVISMFDIIVGKNGHLGPTHTALIDKCVRKIYRSYLDEIQREHVTCDTTKCPTLSDLYQELLSLKEESFEAQDLAQVLYQYAVGSFDTFAHRTNVKPNARFVVYNTRNLGTGMKELGLHICTNDIWNRMIINSKRQVYTWFYIDEFHLLLESDGTTLFLKRIWKMARKWLGVPTGMMQNTEDILRNADTRAIFNNTSFIIMLKEPLMDRQNLAELLNLSGAQLEYIVNPDPGHGLLYNGKIVVPFGYSFPKNTTLYQAMTTSHDVEGAMYK